VVLALALVLAACATEVRSPSGMTTTVIMLRHADRDVMAEELNETGRVRAQALPAAVEDYDIAAIYSPDKLRNLDTGRPLAAQRGLQITVIPPDGAAERMVGDHPGKTVMWIGNKDNLADIFHALGGKGEPPLKYGDLYILEVPDKGATEVTRRRFGP
jgi:hypothetical protein